MIGDKRLMNQQVVNFFGCAQVRCDVDLDVWRINANLPDLLWNIGKHMPPCRKEIGRHHYINVTISDLLP